MMIEFLKGFSVVVIYVGVIAFGIAAVRFMDRRKRRAEEKFK